jgi:Kef-type K+ transport system membrane component KefB
VNHSYQIILTIGALLLVGLLASTIARRTFLPRVTLLLLFGLAIGQEGFDLIPENFIAHFSVIADITLLMVGFLLGGKLSLESLQGSAKHVLWVSFSAALFTVLVVMAGLLLLGVPADIALILACIASATAPAAVMDVVKEMNSTSRFSGMLLSIVALDDIWALVFFAISITVAHSLNGVQDVSMLLHAMWEIGGAIVLGLVLGLPAAFLTGRIKQGQPILSEAIGIVFVCGGLAMWLELSYLIAAITMGAVIVNVAKHHDYPFHAIEDIEAPFMVTFFILAGASLELHILLQVGLVGTAYIFLRIMGKYLGAKLGGRASGLDPVSNQWLGVALLPQAGVAIGMALVASNIFIQHSQLLLTVVISTTIFFEIIGPILTHIAISRVHKAHVKNTTVEDHAGS